MMRQYVADPSSPLRSFCSPSPLSLSTETVPTTSWRNRGGEGDPENVGKEEPTTEERGRPVIPSMSAPGIAAIPSPNEQKRPAMEGFEDIDLATPRQERRWCAPTERDRRGEENTPGHDQEEEGSKHEAYGGSNSEDNGKMKELESSGDVATGQRDHEMLLEKEAHGELAEEASPDNGTEASRPLESGEKA